MAAPVDVSIMPWSQARPAIGRSGPVEPLVVCVRGWSKLAVLLALAAGASCGSRRAPPGAPGAADQPGMVIVPGGWFHLASRTGPLDDTWAWVSVSTFALDETEVTVAAYAECVAARRCKPAPTTVEWEAIREVDRAHWSSSCNAVHADRTTHPVNCVDLEQAAAYCRWAGKRLPTEEEWEWAARNGRRATVYPWGDEAPGDRACWSGEGNAAGQAARAGTCPAASHPADAAASGAKDLAGNVREWTSSRAVLFPDSRGRGGYPGFVARGGGWVDREPWGLGAGVRHKLEPTRRSPDLGFRCARDR